MRSSPWAPADITWRARTPGITSGTSGSPLLFDGIPVYDRWAAEGSRSLKDRVRAKVAALRAEEPLCRADAATRQELAQLLTAAAEQRSA